MTTPLISDHTLSTLHPLDELGSNAPDECSLKLEEATDVVRLLSTAEEFVLATSRITMPLVTSRSFR